MGWKIARFGVVPLALVVCAMCTVGSFGQGETAITLDRGTTYQTMSGWEATATIGQVDYPDQFHRWQDTVLDLAADDLGLNRVRLSVHSGMVENPVDYFAQYINGQISRSEWKEHWYEIINDNADPSVINPNGFQFSPLDYTVDRVVLPLKERLEDRGEELYVNLIIVDFDRQQGSSNTHYQDQPEEYAELVLAVFLHLETTYGWVPDAVEVVLEPDNASWGGPNVGRALAAAGSRLRANGFSPDFIAPSGSSMTSAITWFDQMIQVPGVPQYLSEFSYHRYGGVSDANLQAIASRAEQYGIDTAMLEHIGSGHEDLHKDLKLGQNSAWQQYVLAYPTTDNGAQYFWIDNSAPGNPAVNIGSRTKFLRQYFRFVRRGAVRIGATSTNSSFDPLAFVNADDKHVVVVKADTGGVLSIRGLPAGTYGTKYTTASEYDVDAPDVTISSGQALSARIPERGVITVYAKAAAATIPPSSVTISGPATGLVGVEHSFAATVSPSSATLPVTYAWRATEQTAVTHTGGLSDTVAFTWEVAGSQTITVTATNAAGTATDTYSVDVAQGKQIFLPMIGQSWFSKIVDQALSLCLRR